MHTRLHEPECKRTFSYVACLNCCFSINLTALSQDNSQSQKGGDQSIGPSTANYAGNVIAFLCSPTKSQQAHISRIHKILKF